MAVHHQRHLFGDRPGIKLGTRIALFVRASRGGCVVDHCRHPGRIRFIKVLAKRKVSIRRARRAQMKKVGIAEEDKVGQEDRAGQCVSGVSERKIYCSEREK